MFKQIQTGSYCQQAGRASRCRRHPEMRASNKETAYNAEQLFWHLSPPNAAHLNPSHRGVSPLHQTDLFSPHCTPGGTVGAFCGCTFTDYLLERHLAKSLLYSHPCPEGNSYFSPKDPNFRQTRHRFHKHTNPAYHLCPGHAALPGDQGAGARGGFGHPAHRSREGSNGQGSAAA